MLVAGRQRPRRRRKGGKEERRDGTNGSSQLTAYRCSRLSDGSFVISYFAVCTIVAWRGMVWHGIACVGRYPIILYLLRVYTLYYQRLEERKRKDEMG